MEREQAAAGKGGIRRANIETKQPGAKWKTWVKTKIKTGKGAPGKVAINFHENFPESFFGPRNPNFNNTVKEISSHIGCAPL